MLFLLFPFNDVLKWKQARVVPCTLLLLGSVRIVCLAGRTNWRTGGLAGGPTDWQTGRR